MSPPSVAIGAWLLAGTLAASVALADNPPPGPAPGHAAPKAPAPAAAKRGLDLNAPRVEHVLRRADLQSMVTDHDMPVDDDVRVEKPRYSVEVPVGFFRAVPWALLHPTQAWRVFTPVTEP